MIDRRNYLAAKRRAEIEPVTLAGSRGRFGGGFECDDDTRVWDTLDKMLLQTMALAVRRHGQRKRPPARDAMLGLAKNCRKLNIPFFDHLGARLGIPGPDIPDLALLVRPTPS